MRFYRLHRATVQDSSLGYMWFVARREADKAAAEFNRENIRDDLPSATVDPVDIEPTKAGILEALNLYAGHPDNG